MTVDLIRPTLMVDLDDVLCVNRPYGGIHARLAAYRPEQAPADLYERLFEPEAVAGFNSLMHEFEPRIVLTTSWIALLPDKNHFIDLFSKTGLSSVAQSLHEHWDAAGNRGESRLNAIERWLQQHHRGEPYLVIDDFESGESLVNSKLYRAGRVVLCEVNSGFHVGMLDPARRALSTPWRS